MPSFNSENNELKNYVTDIKLVEGSNLYGLSKSNSSLFLKIYVLFPKYITPCRVFFFLLIYN